MIVILSTAAEVELRAARLHQGIIVPLPIIFADKNLSLARPMHLQKAMFTSLKLKQKKYSSKMIIQRCSSTKTIRANGAGNKNLMATPASSRRGAKRTARLSISRGRVTLQDRTLTLIKWTKHCHSITRVLLSWANLATLIVRKVVQVLWSEVHSCRMKSFKSSLLRRKRVIGHLRTYSLNRNRSKI